MPLHPGASADIDRSNFHATFLSTFYLPEEGVWKPEGKPIDGGATCTPWDELCAFITQDRRVESKGEAKLFIPGKLVDAPVANEKGSTLINENVEHLSFLSIDIEGGGSPDKPKKLLTIEDIVAIGEHLQSLPFETVFFNSFSDAGPGKGRRGRILIPLAAPIDPTHYGQSRQTQGKWWSRYIFIPLVQHVLGDLITHEGIRSGLEGAKLLAGKYYVRSALKQPHEEPWIKRFNEGKFWDARQAVLEANEREADLQEMGERDVTGLGIPASKLKKAMKRWEESENPDESRASQAMQRVLRGEREADAGAGFATNNNLCRMLAKWCMPFDPKVVVQELFKRSCVAWTEISKQTVEHELAYVEKNLQHWVELYRKQQLDLSEATRNWRGKLAFKPNGDPRNTTANVQIVLENHPGWKGVLGYDVRSDVVCFMKRAPSEKKDALTYPRKVRDTDVTAVLPWLQTEVEISVESRAVHECMQEVATQAAFDPVMVYFDGLKWDGKPRLDTWLIDIAKVADNPYTRAVSSRWLISAVARTYEPGCKADQMLVLEGPQGCGKSTLYRALCADPAWFSDHIPDMHSKDAFLAMRGKLIIEVSELNALQRSTNEARKKFLSSPVDSYRPPYGRVTEDVKRRVIFGASTNEGQYTSDVTGARRYWSVRIEDKINISKLRRMRDQLWAEAVHRYRDGFAWWLDTPFLEKLAEREQAERRQEDPFEELLAKHLEQEAQPIPDELDTTFQSIGTTLRVYEHKGEVVVLRESVWSVLGVDRAARTPQLGTRVRHAMRALGWDRGPQVRIGETRPRTFKRVGTDAADVVPIR